jgi:hypothetical protein
MSQFEPLVHYCTVPSGSLAGNKNSQAITAADIEFDFNCSVCGELLAPDLKNIVAHIYEQLTNNS